MAYVMNDNRASGGILDEHDAVTCCHCQAIVPIRKYVKQGGWCYNCDATVCWPCYNRMQTEGCAPFMRQVEIALGGTPRKLWGSAKGVAL